MRDSRPRPDAWRLQSQTTFTKTGKISMFFAGWSVEINLLECGNLNQDNCKMLLTKRFLAVLFAILGTGCHLETMDTTSAHEPALKEVFKGDFLIGAALKTTQFTSSEKENSEVKLIQKHFNSITPENVLKWEQIHPG